MKKLFFVCLIVFVLYYKKVDGQTVTIPPYLGYWPFDNDPITGLYGICGPDNVLSGTQLQKERPTYDPYSIVKDVNRTVMQGSNMETNTRFSLGPVQTTNLQTGDFSVALWVWVQRVDQINGVESHFVVNSLTQNINTITQTQWGLAAQAFNFTQNTFGFIYSVQPTVNGSVSILFGSIPGLSLETWHHLAVTYFGSNGSCFGYLDGVQSQRVDPNVPAGLVGPFPFYTTGYEQLSLFAPNTANTQMGTPTWYGDSTVKLDELYIFGDPLTPEQVRKLINTPTSIPSGNIVTGNVPPPPVINQNTYTLKSNVSGGTGVYTYGWKLIKTTAARCSLVNTNQTDQSAVVINFGNTDGSFVFGFCATDGISTLNTNVQVNVIVSTPVIVVNLATTLQVDEGENFTLSVSANGYPGPFYQWQITFDSSVVEPPTNGTSARSIIGSEYDTDIFYTRQSSNDDGWTSLPGASAQTSTYKSDTPVNSSLIGAKIRVRVSNTNNGTVSPNTTVYSRYTSIDVILAPDNSSTNLGAIIGGVLGGLLFLICCCLLICLLILFILFKKGVLRRRKAAIKLRPPDYAQLAYANYLDDQYTNDKKMPKQQNEALEKLEVLLFEDGHYLATVLAENEEINQETLKSLVWLFQSDLRGYKLIEDLITREVENSNSEGTLFRANSPACQMYTVWVRTFGIEYIWGTLVLPVNELNDTAAKRDTNEKEEGGYTLKLNDTSRSHTTSKRMGVLAIESMEVDPLKMSDEDAADRTVNTIQLWIVAQKLFSAILKSEEDVPEDIRKILHHVNSIVNEKFGNDAAFKGMGAFMFLRFICPSLLGPHQWGLLEDVPHPVAQRQLILIGKVIQNLANGTLPGSKEDYMEKLNEFILSNQGPLIEWYKKVTSKHGPSTFAAVPDEVKRNSLIIIYEFIVHNKAEIIKQLKQSFDAEGEDVAEELDSIIQEMGKAKFIKKK